MNLFFKTVKKICCSSLNEDIKAQYDSEINNTNYTLFMVVSYSALVVITVLLGISIWVPLLMVNRGLYLGLDVILVLLIASTQLYLRPRNRSVLPILYILLLCAYAFAIEIGTIKFPSSNATTICVLITISPMFILDYPIRLFVCNVFTYLAFSYTAIKYKQYSYAMDDIANLGVFFICSIPVSYFSVKSRVENITNKAKLRKQSEMDFLTGIYNRMAIDRYMNQSMKESPLAALIMIDVDNFKQINDTFGHNKGDEVLKEIASILEKCTNHAGMTARYGGDEFLIFLPNITDRTSLDTIAKNIMERVNITIQKENISMAVTISMGVTINTSHENDCDTICHQADEAMYQIKQLDKNGYAFYG